MTHQPTVYDLFIEVLPSISAKTLPTYRTGLERLVLEYGDRPIGTVRSPDLERLRDEVRREVGEHTVARALRTGRRLRSYDPDAHGQGAAENFVRGVRKLFRYAVAMGYLSSSPADHLQAPRRLPAPERPLTEPELTQVWAGALEGSSDPELDELVLTFLRHTAARREGCLNLCLGNLEFDDPSVWLTEKGGAARRLPLARSLVGRLDTFGRGRGAEASHDAVFRYAKGTPMGRRRFNVIFDRVDRNCGWTEPLDVGAHWIRHTTLADVDATSGLRVAEAYAGHVPSSVGVIGGYTKVTFNDLVDAYEGIFGPRG
jgi:site-specific recombinase XerD